MNTKRDYLVDAAKQLHIAQERDANEEYEAAFSHYKHGVELLLSGVTVDPSRERRDAVKRKISQYLKRAEEIFNCHLQRPGGNAWGAVEGYSSLRFRPIRVLSAAVENLKHCRVVKIIDKVQLVYDPSSGTTFVLKALMKSGRSGHGAATLIPQSVPFMVQLQKFYVSDDALYLQLQHIPGGRLWGHFKKYQDRSVDAHGGKEPFAESEDSTGPSHNPLDGRLPSPPPSPAGDAAAGGIPELQVRRWGSQLVMALETLHREGVLCRDLNPRNLLLGDKGDVCLTYFGQWREVDATCCPEAAEQLYVAPEVLGVGTVTEACDWWSLGVLLYEMLTGQPLYTCLGSAVSAHTQLPLPDTLSSAAASLLTQLLYYDPDRRLGSGPEGVQRIKRHPFFTGIHWNRLG
ncbi:ribosomal protein S6 kinase-like 1 [Spea bombifrons]|uniref:ribosomal protein S6 kinase-like 1 n=1 Tax=Spea bombifrons TaxID=233779 RepID=UPI00234B6884|nr:ribosomal protein S6 kinase-like 1 [Spea bombifrons]